MSPAEQDKSSALQGMQKLQLKIEEMQRIRQMEMKEMQRRWTGP
jgi:hypothetical protein